MASDLQQAEDLLNQGPKTYDLEDQDKKRLLEQQQKLLNPTTDEILKGIGTAGEGLMTPTPQYNYNVGLGGNTAAQGKPVIDAITQRNINRSNDTINAMKNQLKLNEPVRDEARLKQASQNVGQQTQIALNNNKILKQYDLDKRRLQQYKDQQRSNIMASILGVIGTVGGIGLAVATGGAAAPALAGAFGAFGGQAASDYEKGIGFGGGSGPSLMKK